MRIISLGILLLIAIPCVGADSSIDPPSFFASCVQTGSQRYDFGTSYSGKVISDQGWAPESLFSSPFTFAYKKGAKSVLVDGQWNYVVVAKTSDSLVFSSLQDDEAATNLTSYALDLSLQKLVYSKVQMTHLLGRGIMVRAYSFDCQVKSGT